MTRKKPETVVVSGFSEPISKSVRNVGCFGTIRTTYRRKSFGFPLTSCGARKKSSASLFLDFFRPLRQPLLPSSATGGGRKRCLGNPQVGSSKSFHYQKGNSSTVQCCCFFWRVAPKKISADFCDIYGSTTRGTFGTNL